MKKSELIFTAALVPVDYVMLCLAGLAAYGLRTSSLIADWRPVLFNVNLSLEKYLGLVLATAVFLIIIYAVSGLYEIRRANGLLEDFLRLAVATSAGLVGIIIYSFIRREWFDSRFLIFAAWMLAVIFVFFGRVLVRGLQKYLVKHGVGAHYTLIIGGDKVSQEVIKEIKERPSLGYVVVEHFKDLNLERIKIIVAERQIDDIVLANPDFAREQVLELIDFCEEKHLNFKFVPNLFQALTTNIDFDTLGGVPLIELKRTALDGWGAILKRIIDFAGALAAIVVFSPIMGAVAILIKFDSPGPVIYKNLRVGPRGLFKTYKFRSMKIEYCVGPEYDQDGQASRLEDVLIAHQSGRKGPVYKIINDPRRTKLGRFLEKWSLDELPQFFNVLIGNMSLVGPRPHTPKEVAKYEKWHKKVFNIKPGVTGMAQISGRSEIDFDEEAKLDTYYIENWSWQLDLKIMLKTPLAVFFRKSR